MRQSISALLKSGGLLLVISLVLTTSCDDPGGLEAVAGFEGKVIFEQAWPDTLASAVIVVFDVGLNLDSLNIQGYSVMDHFITFGTPFEPVVGAQDYFIQLKAGDYMAMIIGLTIEPALLLTNEDLFQDIQSYIVVPENSAPRGIRIMKQEINEQSDWSVGF